MTTAFVTGGSGYLGRNLIRKLVADGVTVRALTRSDAANATVVALGGVPVPGDLDDAARIRDALPGVDVIYHCAATVDDWGKYADFHRINVDGTLNVLYAARDVGVKRFVHVSTEAVLAGSKIVDVDETAPRPARPIGLYAITKGEAEDVVTAFAGVECVIVRPRYIWGNDDTSVLAQLVGVVRRGQWRWIDGGAYLTSTCHVDNVVEGMLLAGERGKPGEIYFLTDGPPVPFRPFIGDLLRTQGVDPGEKTIPRSIAYALAATAEAVWSTGMIRGRPPLTRMAILLGGSEVTVRDDKARRELGYVGKTSREVGLATVARLDG